MAGAFARRGAGAGAMRLNLNFRWRPVEGTGGQTRPYASYLLEAQGSGAGRTSLRTWH